MAVASWTIDRGRSYELDTTEAGTASIQVNDVDGVLDPTNAGGPYFNQLNPLTPAALALQNPVTSAWTTLFTGYVEQYSYDVDPSQVVIRPEVSLVDGLEVLAATKLQPTLYGDAAPAGLSGNVYYYVQTHVDDRINQILNDVGWPVGARSIFSGNVNLKRGTYAPSDDALQAISETCDAEFVGVANRYIAKNGDFTFHGRLARFDPTNPDYGLGAWKCGDGAAVAASISDTAQIRSLTFARDKNGIINSASALPQGVADVDIPGQLFEDAGSILTYGKRSWSAENLLTDGGITDGNDDLAETFLFSTYRVDNYKDPQTRISQVSFKSLAPEDPRAPALWDLICGVEISDTLAVTTTHPGGGGFSAAPYFVEGVHYEVRPATGRYHDVTLTLDLSPAANYTSNPF